MRSTKFFTFTILALLLLSGFAGILVLPGSPVGTASAEGTGSGGGYVCINFDDGAQSVYDYAFPALASRGITATAYITTSWVGTIGGASSIFECMDTPELLTLQAAGWEIGSHGVNHTSVPTLTAAQIDYEMRESKANLTAMGLDVSTYAYPYGNYTDGSVAIGKMYYERQRTTDGIAQYRSDYPLTVGATGSYVAQTWADAQKWIELAVKTNTTVVLLYHLIDADGTFKNMDYTVQDLADYIAEMRDSYGLQTINYRDLPNAHPELDTYVWDGEGATIYANESANWRKVSAAGVVTNNVLPVSGCNIIWNNTGNKDCNFNLNIEAYSWTLAHGYSKIVRQVLGFDIAIDEGGLAQYGKSSSILDFHASQKTICAGSFVTKGSHNELNLVMTGTDVTLSGGSSVIDSVRIDGRVHNLFEALTTPKFTVSSGGEMVLQKGSMLAITASTDQFHVYGKMTGEGTLRFRVLNANGVYNLSNVTVGTVLLALHSADTASRNITIHSTSGSQIGALSVQDYHATLPLTVILASDSLKITNLTMGPRTILRGGSCAITTGDGNTTAWDSSAATWTPETSTVIMGGTGTIKLGAGQTFYDLNVTGAVSLLSDVTVTHAFSLTGTINKNGHTLTLPAGWSNEIISTPGESIIEDAAYSYTPQSNQVGTFAVTESADWLTWDGTALSGTPDNDDVGSYSVSVQFSNGVSTLFQNFSVTVTNVAPAFTSDADTHWRNQFLYIYDADTTDEGAGLTYSMTSTSDELIINQTTGVVSGTINGTAAVMVTITADDGNGGIAQQEYMITMNSWLWFTSDPVTNGTAGLRYMYEPLVSTGQGPVTYTFSLDGLDIIASDTSGRLLGTIREAGVYNISIRAEDAHGNVAFQNYTLTIDPAYVMHQTDTMTVVIVLVFLALLTFIGVKYPIFFTLTGMAYLAVALWYVNPLDPIISMLMAAAGIMFAIWGVWHFFK